MKFTWDRRKDRINLDRHGISFAEATTVFGDPLAASIPDPDHSEGEERIVTMGSPHEIALSLSVTLNKAREATPYERKKYES